jgi:2-polyprenyl-3-methyl-5-hydroxy-6-metoxy-1,4-benzoquinol methylase
MNAAAESEEQRILHAWRTNAAPWSRAVRARCIASRRLATDRAVIEAVTGLGARRVLDVGCGEGWLARALSTRGLTVVGIDAVPALIEDARAHGGEFHVADYATLAARRLSLTACEAAVCNFCLLGAESVRDLLQALPHYLVPGGWLVIQTLHPLVAGGGQAYADGWREGSWAGCGEGFADPAPWYFRTVSSWLALLREAGYTLTDCREPALPGAPAPCSLLLIARLVRP